MDMLGLYTPSTNESSWVRSVASFTRSRPIPSITGCDFQNLFTNPSVRENRLGKGSWCPDFEHKKSREVLWVKKGYPVLTHSQPAILDCQPPSGGRLLGYSGIRLSGPDDEIQSMCTLGQLDKALDALLCMHEQGKVPSKETYISFLRACTRKKALAQAKRMHAHLAYQGLELTRYLGEVLVNTLVKCGSIHDALHVFGRLPHRTVISWTAVISGYVQAGQFQEALTMYQCMKKEHVNPGKYTFVSLLKACAGMADLKLGKQIHNDVLNYRCDTDLAVSTCLVDMYAKCGSIVDAQAVFDGLPLWDLVSCSVMLAGYARQCQSEKALQLYLQMQEEGIGADARTFMSVLQACASLGEKESMFFVDWQSHGVESLQKGKEIHAELQMRGYDGDVFVGSALISMYTKCGGMVDAHIVFNSFSQQNVVLWNAMLTGCAHQNQEEIALQLFREMQEQGVSPNDRTFVSALQACGSLAEEEAIVLVDDQLLGLEGLQKGKALHAEAKKRGFDSYTYVGNALVSMYTKCGDSVDAQHVFDRLWQRDVVSWNAMLAGYAQQGQGDKCLQLFCEMQEDFVSLDSLTFVSVLQACSSLAGNENVVAVDGQLLKVRCLQNGKAIHAESRKRGYDSDVFVASSLISMYGKCGSMVDAQLVFDGLSWRNVVSWNAIMTVYAQNREADKVFHLYTQLLQQDVSPDETTYLCILGACGNMGALDTCFQIHQKLVSTRVELSVVLGSSLIHAYGACARMKDAQDVFDSLPQHNVVSWTALIAGYAREGSWEKCLQRYEEMRSGCTEPNAITFLSILSACSHAGRVDKAVVIFESMSRDYGITPDIEHYVCLVDLLGRAGHFTIIEDILSKLPMQPDASLWRCLLGACQKYGNVLLGERAFEHAVILQPKDSAPYVMMSNIYAHAGKGDSAKAVHDLRQNVGATKNPGQSWIQYEDQVHTFTTGEQNHQLLEQVNVLLQHLVPTWEGGDRCPH